VVPLAFSRAPRAASGVDVCVIGNLTIDVILRGVDEIPRWGQETLSETRTESVAGQAAGMAFAGAALGARVDVVSLVGDDDSGTRIRRELREAGIGVEAVSVVPAGTTPLAVALVRRDGERAFISDLGTLGTFDVASVTQRFPEILDASVVALVGTSNLPGVDLVAAAGVLSEVRRAGALTVFDPGWDADGWSQRSVAGIRAVLAETDLFLPNLDEARALTGRTLVGDVLAVLAPLCAGVAIVKGGEDGSYVAVDGAVLRVAALASEVDNAVGAGDVYNAAVIAGYLHERDVVASMALGTAAASIYVARRAGRFPTSDEVADLARRVTTSTD